MRGEDLYLLNVTQNGHQFGAVLNTATYLRAAYTAENSFPS